MKISDIASDTIMVNKNAFSASLEALEAYYEELVQDFQLAVENDIGEEWLEGLQQQIEIISDILNGFSASVKGDETMSTLGSKRTLN